MGCDKYRVTEEALREAAEMHRQGRPVKEVRKFLKENSELKKSQVYEYAKKIAGGEIGGEKKEEGKREGELAYEDLYVYNSHTKQYVFFTDKIMGMKLVLKESVVKSMIERYSSFDGDQSSINQMVASYGIRREGIIFILRALKKTHDSLPVLSEELLREEPDEIVDDLLTQRLFIVNREFEKKSWKKTVEESRSWRRFTQRELNPYKEFVEGFAYQHKPFKLDPKKAIKRDRCYMAGVSDPHFGAYALKKDLYHGEEWNIEKAKESFEKYTHDLFARISLERDRPRLLKILGLGDVAHGPSGRTEKGTPLENTFPMGEVQVEAGFAGFDYQIQYALDMGFEVEFEGVPGNHSYFGDWAIYKFIEKAYQRDERVKVRIATERWHAFTYLNSLFVMEHGASPFYKSKVPKAGSERDSYIQRLLLARPKELAETKYRYFLTADQHKLEITDNNGFEFYRFGTMVRGDRYADHLNLSGRARQNVLEVDEEGVRGVLNFWMD